MSVLLRLLRRSGHRLISRLWFTANGAIPAWGSRHFASQTSCARSQARRCSLCRQISRSWTARRRSSIGRNSRDTPESIGLRKAALVLRSHTHRKSSCTGGSFYEFHRALACSNIQSIGDIGNKKRAYVNGMECFRDGRLLIVFRKGVPTGGVLGQVKLVICYWPNTGQRVANGTIPLQLRARNSNKNT